MNKKLFFVLVIIALLIYSYINHNLVVDKILNISTTIQKEYHKLITPIENIVTQLTSTELIEADIKNKELALLTLTTSNELNKLLNSYSLANFNPKLKHIRALSISDFRKPYRLWLEYDKFDQNRIYGLIHKTYAAGIVISDKHRPQAILNHDKECSYSVKIGKFSAPGITKGSSKNSKYITVDYIPAWITIKEGDEVVTSGLDNIFFAGVKVGVVRRTESSQGYQKAYVEPYNKNIQPKYFYIIEEL
jgi:rod shape-determining protein MreC